MNGQTLKKIPYGVANYDLFRRENLYYVDKTSYIRTIEEKGHFLLFIRPRRFGKSLFLSVLNSFYNILYKDRFDFFFSGTRIGRGPTPLRNSFLVLKFDFSAVDPDISQVEESFLKHARHAVHLFFSQYRALMGIDMNAIEKELEAGKSASDVLNTLLKHGREKNRQIFVIIDEYDNFANTILSTAGEPAYRHLTHGEGFFRAFFNTLKSGTSDSDAPISRLFLTGVSPITLDDVTSGFNIARNISIDPDINEMLGFTGDEVGEIIDYYRQAGKIRHSTRELMEIMVDWYNHYRFSTDAHTGVFNSVQVWYFLNEYFLNGRVPLDLADRNVRIDYQKLRHLILIDRKGKPAANGNFSRLTEIIEKGEVHAAIERGFPVDALTSPDHFTSLLFYFGLLTISGVDQANKAILTIPNETVKRLYYDYIKDAYAETQVFSLDMDKYSRLMDDMAFNGNWQPMIDYIAGRIGAAMSLRDLICGEKALQAFWNVYLGLSNFYIIHAERELNKGYADLVMEPFLAQYPALKYAYLVEIKYLKPGDGEPSPGQIEKLKAEAESQLHQYGLDEKLHKTLGRTTLIPLLLIFSGLDLLHAAALPD